MWIVLRHEKLQFNVSKKGSATWFMHSNMMKNSFNKTASELNTCVFQLEEISILSQGNG